MRGGEDVAGRAKAGARLTADHVVERAVRFSVAAAFQGAELRRVVGQVRAVDGVEAVTAVHKDLLREALDHINDRPWDDSTMLHARISTYLGLPIHYPENVKTELLSDYEGPHEPERLRKALSLAMCMLSRHESGDSRCASDEFVALAAVDCGIAEQAEWDLIEAALKKIAAEKDTVKEGD